MKQIINNDPIERQAVRILFILYFCHDFSQNQLSFLNDYVFCIDSETKVQKIDFWIRYPDHLASALIRGCRAEGKNELINKANEVKQVVREIIQNREPTLRWVPMHKYLRGAYEPLDDVIAYLSSLNLAFRRTDQHQTHYYLSQKGSDAVDGLLKDCSETIWYSKRCNLINSFMGHLNGIQIRNLQYLEREYADTPYYEIIEHNESRVIEYYKETFGEDL